MNGKWRVVIITEAKQVFRKNRANATFCNMYANQNRVKPVQDVNGKGKFLH